MSGFLPSGLHVNKPVVFVILGFLVLIVVLYKFLWVSEHISLHTSGLHSILGSLAADSGQHSDDKATGKAVRQALEWKLSTLPDPPQLTDEIKKAFGRESRIIEVDMEGMKVPVYVKQVINNQVKHTADILFLHGAKFSSQNWEDIGALDQVVNWGFRAVAVDLPGKGKTTTKLDHVQVPKFLPALIKSLKMERPIIISPSMSGQYSIPYLFMEPESAVEKALAFVPISPVGTSIYSNSFSRSQLPTLIVFGSKDPSGPKTLKDLQVLPNGIIAEINDAGHVCYLHKSAGFFKYLYSFLKQLKTE